MSHSLKDQIPELLHLLEGLNTAEALQLMAQKFPGKVTFSSSFSYEDQVITHDILGYNTNISIFTLETGRLFPETYSVWNSTNSRYNTHITAYYPNTKDIQEYVNDKGPNAFYESV